MNRHGGARAMFVAACAAAVCAVVILSGAIGRSEAASAQEVPANGIDLVVVLRDDFLTEQVNENARSAATGSELLSSVPAADFVVVHWFTSVPVVIVRVADEQTAAMVSLDPLVEHVDRDLPGGGLLADVVPLVGADIAHANGADGSGVRVAVIDSGVEAGHPDLSSSIVSEQLCFGYNGGVIGTGFCPDGTDLQIGTRSDVPAPAVDGHGHGTHVASVITSDGVVAPIGVAPGAEVLAVKALDDQATFRSFSLNVVAALDYIASHPELDIDLINLSLGTGQLFVGDCDTATASAVAASMVVDVLRTQGVAVIAASGNEGLNFMPLPACLSGVIAVGASDDDDRALALTSSNAATDVYAPGSSVLASGLGGSAVTNTGTSVAAAVTTGCAALLLDAGAASSVLSLEARLRQSSVGIRDSRNGITFPRVECSPLERDTAVFTLTIEKVVVGPAPAEPWQFLVEPRGECFVDPIASYELDMSLAAEGGESGELRFYQGCNVTVTETDVAGYVAEPAPFQQLDLTEDARIIFTNTGAPVTPTATEVPTSTPTPTAVPSPTPNPSPTPTPAPSPTATPWPVPTVTPEPLPIGPALPTPTPTPLATAIAAIPLAGQVAGELSGGGLAIGDASRTAPSGAAGNGQPAGIAVTGRSSSSTASIGALLLAAGATLVIARRRLAP